nr:PHP domain-containing protein [Sedimentibacter sp.]
MYDFEIAFYLYKISRLLEIFEENKYKTEAYFKAAMAVDSYSTFITEAYKTDSLKNIEGIGDSSARIIKAVIETGKCSELEKLEIEYNIEDYSLILSHGLSTKTIRKLFNNNIKTVSNLHNSFNSDIETLDFGKSEKEKVRKFLKRYKENSGYYLYSYAYCLRNELLELLNKDRDSKIAFAKESEWKEKVNCISVVCKADSYDYVKEQLSSSNRYNEILSSNNEEIKCVTAFGIPVVVCFTNSIIVDSAIQPVLHGDLHMHTKWSDGKHSIEEMAGYATKLGRKYIGVSDHTYSLKVARGISEVDALQQIEEIHALKSKGIKVLSSIEVEVLKDGTLDFSDATLAKFDYVIAGIHTYLQQSQIEMQARIEKALSSPYVNILAHPTGKLLGRPGVLFSDREPCSVPFKTILDICVKNNVVIELNCFPERFDIGVEHFEEIIKSGAFVSVGTDSHSAAHLNCLEYAEIMLARYPKLKKKVINTFSYNKLKKFFSEQRQSASAEIKFTQNASERLDFNFYFANHSGIITGSDYVIGIDLTGNEAKPSGWAVLTGGCAITKAICTDEELIQESLKYNPKVVSIDSPLSYPEGRDCTDPNCECHKYGITRYCERLLSSFGIGVYPCLIPSMEKLTNRGIALAKKFRDLGVEVIESYPGVAQDILSIRRKQNGLDHLKNSYKNFGIMGDYLSAQKISHDELDAISSALVGLFYLNDQYVALGNDKENFLIVPSIAPAPKKRVVLGLTGEIGTGKTTLAEYLCFKHGFKSLRYSQVIRRLYSCDDSRSTLQNIGSDIAKSEEKQRQLSLEIIKEIEAHPNTNYVVDGLRHRIDFDTLSEHFGDRFTLLEIKSTFTNKFHRYNKRSFKPISKEQFQAILYNEAEKDIMLLSMLCYTYNNIITNNKTFKDYFESVELKLKEILCQ